MKKVKLTQRFIYDNIPKLDDEIEEYFIDSPEYESLTYHFNNIKSFFGILNDDNFFIAGDLY